MFLLKRVTAISGVWQDPRGSLPLLRALGPEGPEGELVLRVRGPEGPEDELVLRVRGPEGPEDE